LVLLGTVELARQAAQRIRDMHPYMTVEIEQGAENIATGKADCTVATYQTLLSRDRLSKFNPQDFKCIFVDEAHHAASAAYLRVLSRFDPRIQPPKVSQASAELDLSIDEKTGELVQAELEPAGIPAEVDFTRSGGDDASNSGDPVAIMGFSATFARHDGLALSAVFDHIVYHIDFVDMITQGWYASFTGRAAS
jgi:ATP-dependent helicase IRC3